MVTKVTLTDAEGRPVQAEAYNKGNDRFVVTQQGEKYREVERNGVITYQPMSAEANRRQLADVPAGRTTTQPGDQSGTGNNRRQQPVETGRRDRW